MWRRNRYLPPAPWSNEPRLIVPFQEEHTRPQKEPHLIPILEGTSVSYPPPLQINQSGFFAALDGGIIFCGQKRDTTASYLGGGSA